MAGQNKKDINAKLGRIPQGCERLWIGDEPRHIRKGELAIACHQPITNESFGVLVEGLDLNNPTSIKRAILAKAASLAKLKQREVMPTQLCPASG